MAKSKLHVNWSPVTIDPTLPNTALFTATEITDVKVTKGGKIISFFGDARRFARGKKVVEAERGISITTGNSEQFAGMAEGTICTITATLQDMNNGLGEGAITVTLVNAVLKSNPFGGGNNQFASATVEFEAFADASDTDPLSYVVAGPGS